MPTPATPAPDLSAHDLTGSRVAVGFRPSGSLHVGNLLSIGWAAVLADRLDLMLDLQCCDTDWSAHIHQQTYPEENRVMTPFYSRTCPCGDHGNVAEHRMDELEPFLDGLRDAVDADIETGYLSHLDDEHYRDALRTLLENMDAFDAIFGGGFRSRYRSPVTAACNACGHAHAKGASYSGEHDALVAACRTPDCPEGFLSQPLDGSIGVYYLADPVRDPGRDVAVHVFGGDYRDARKGQKTSKLTKVAKITELATGTTPEYVLAPLIADDDGTPLSKSKGTGLTLDRIDNPERYARDLVPRIRGWMGEARRHLPQHELRP